MIRPDKDKMIIKGLHTALITPFFDDGSIDIDGFVKHLQLQLEAKVDGLVLLGTTGEAPTLNMAERELLIRTAVNEINQQIPLMIGVGSNDTPTTIKYAQQAKDLGGDALLIVTPYYNKPTQKGIFEHFSAASKAVDLPVQVYNIASRTGVNIETATLKRMVKQIPQIVSVKEASGDLNQIADVISEIKNTKPDFTVLSGDDALTLPLMSLGGDGVVSVISNLIPKDVKQMLNYTYTGDYIQARKMFYQHYDLLKAAFIESNPIPIKYMMRKIDLPAGRCRPPLSTLEEENKKIIDQILENNGFLDV